MNRARWQWFYYHEPRKMAVVLLVWTAHDGSGSTGMDRARYRWFWFYYRGLRKAVVALLPWTAQDIDCFGSTVMDRAIWLWFYYHEPLSLDRAR